MPDEADESPDGHADGRDDQSGDHHATRPGNAGAETRNRQDCYDDLRTAAPAQESTTVWRITAEEQAAAQKWDKEAEGEVTVYDPPLRWATRGRVMPGTILDTDYRLREEAGAVVVSVTKVATGPMTAEEAAGIARFGDLTSYAPAIQKLAAS